MANYPISLDNFTNPTGVDSLNSPSHALQHADANDAIEALEAKLGIGNSPAGSATAGHVLVASAGGTTSWTTVGASAINTTGGTAGQYLSAGTAGVAQWASVPEAGLTLITTQSVTTASNIYFTDVFSSTYTHYRLLISGNGSTNSYFAMRVRNSTTDYTGSQYRNAVYFFTTSGGTGFNHTGTANDRINSGYYGTGDTNFFIYDFYPKGTNLTVLSHSFEATSAHSIGGNNVTSTANVTGLNIYPNSGTFTGTFTLYGYRKS